MSDDVGAITRMKVDVAIVVDIPDVGAFAVTYPNRGRS